MTEAYGYSISEHKTTHANTTYYAIHKDGERQKVHQFLFDKMQAENYCCRLIVENHGKFPWSLTTCLLCCSLLIEREVTMIYRLKITEPQAIRIAKRLVRTTGIARHVWTRGTRAFIASDKADLPNTGYPVEIAFVTPSDYQG